MATHGNTKRAAKAAFPHGGVVYYWPRGFLLLAPSFVVDRGERPTRRPSIRVMLSLRAPFEIEFSDGARLQTHAVMMSAEVRRRRIIARECGFVLLDLAVSTPEYATLAPLLTGRSILPLEPETLRALFPDFEAAITETAVGDSIHDLRGKLVHAIAGVYPCAPDYDPRVEAALRVIQERRLEDVTLQRIAEAVHLSPDRLRHLFREQVGYTVSHFARTSAVWKALSAWSEGKQLTQLAHEVGFHDYSHFSHAFKEMFGFNPGLAVADRHFEFVACT